MAEQLSKMEKANAFYMKQLLLKTHGHWLKWTKDVCARKQMGFYKIEKLVQNRLCGYVFTAWLKQAQEEVRQHLFFKNVEKQQDIRETEGMTSHTHSRAIKSDQISQLPERAQLTIFGFVSANLKDLASCARVCRSWKAITQNSQLWSKINLSPLRLSVVDSVLNTLIQNYRPFIVNMNLRGCSLLTQQSLKNIGQYIEIDWHGCGLPFNAGTV